MQKGSIIILAATLIGVLYCYRKSYILGLCASAFGLVLWPKYISISLPGALPELTIHRLILIILLWQWWKNRFKLPQDRAVPGKGLFVFWIITNFLSLFNSTEFIAGLKLTLALVIEQTVLFVVLIKSLRNKEDCVRLAQANLLAILSVAILAFAERYTHVNFVENFVGFQRHELVGRDVVSTYAHRILLGAGMAMGIPLVYAIGFSKKRGNLALVGTGLAFMVFSASCYFGQSRGPWIGAVIGLMIVCVFASKAVRIHMAAVIAVAGILAISNTGVRTTLIGKWKDTFDKDSFKGGTYQYRWELWVVAMARISSSPSTLLFGVGPGAARAEEFVWDLSYRHQAMRISSWDNQYAYALLTTGFVGFLSMMWLYSKICWDYLARLRASSAYDRNFLAGLFSSVMVLLYMMTNVLIFAPQLYYFFWTLLAGGLCYAIGDSAMEETPTLEPANDAGGGTLAPAKHPWLVIEGGQASFPVMEPARNARTGGKEL